MSGARLAWARGGEAVLVRLDADAIVLRSTRPWPPGSRPEGRVAGDDASGGAPGGMLRVKVHSCKKQPEGDYLVEGRPLDLSREARERLQGG